MVTIKPGGTIQHTNVMTTHHTVAPVPKPRIKRPAQVINSMTIEPPCQRFTSAEPFNGQEVVKNYTGESTHSEGSVYNDKIQRACVLYI